MPIETLYVETANGLRDEIKYAMGRTRPCTLRVATGVSKYVLALPNCPTMRTDWKAFLSTLCFWSIHRNHVLRKRAENAPAYGYCGRELFVGHYVCHMTHKTGAPGTIVGFASTTDDRVRIKYPNDETVFGCAENFVRWYV